MNCVQLMGRLTKDPEIKQTTSGKSYCRFSIAVNNPFAKDKADFINCVAWEKKAEFVSTYFKKGNRILISGRISTGSYEVNGEKRSSFDILAEQIEFIESKSNSSNTGTTYTEQANNSYADEDPLDEDEFPF